MARYAEHVSKRVEVQYRSGDIFLTATGTLVGDSGRSIFLEEHFTKDNRARTFRWEIPYVCIMRVGNAAEPPSGFEAPAEQENAPPSSPVARFSLRPRTKEA